MPVPADGFVVFAHGSGSSRRSPRNRFVAEKLREAGMATVLMDLLTPEEEAPDSIRGHLRFDVTFLARAAARRDRLGPARQQGRRSAAGYFGASTGAAAALLAAPPWETRFRLLSRGEAGPIWRAPRCHRVLAPTLLIVGGADPQVLELNRTAFDRFRCEKELRIVPEASHLFSQPGALEEVARMAAAWFRPHLGVNSQDVVPVGVRLGCVC